MSIPSNRTEPSAFKIRVSNYCIDHLNVYYGITEVDRTVLHNLGIRLSVRDNGRELRINFEGENEYLIQVYRGDSLLHRTQGEGWPSPTELGEAVDRFRMKKDLN